MNYLCYRWMPQLAFGCLQATEDHLLNWVDIWPFKKNFGYEYYVQLVVTQRTNSLELIHLLCVKASTIHVRGRGQLKPYSYISKEAPQNKK